jgi:hypothetical protein
LFKHNKLIYFIKWMFIIIKYINNIIIFILIINIIYSLLLLLFNNIKFIFIFITHPSNLPLHHLHLISLLLFPKNHHTEFYYLLLRFYIRLKYQQLLTRQHCNFPLNLTIKFRIKQSQHKTIVFINR